MGSWLVFLLFPYNSRPAHVNWLILPCLPYFWDLATPETTPQPQIPAESLKLLWWRTAGLLCICHTPTSSPLLMLISLPGILSFPFQVDGHLLIFWDTTQMLQIQEEAPCSGLLLHLVQMLLTALMWSMTIVQIYLLFCLTRLSSWKMGVIFSFFIP